MDTKALRQKILDLAIRGKLVPQDPNDEPASVLLEKIREQKQQMVREGKLKKKDIKNDSVIYVGEDSLHYEKFADGSVKCIEDEIPFEVPEGWAWCHYSDIIELYSGQDLTSDRYNDIGDGIPYITGASNLEHGKVIINRWTTTPTTHATIDDLLLTVKGSGVGKMAFCNIDDAHIARQIMALRCTTAITPQYLHIAISAMLSDITAQANGIIPGIRRKIVLGAYLPLPPISEQNKICEIADSSLHIIDAIDNDKDELKNIIQTAKSKILDLAIHGKLVPQNPDDEPASTLLDHIRAEKEELIKQGKIKRNKKESIIFKGDDNSYYEKVSDTVNCIDEDIPFELPEGWSFIRLKTAWELISGRDLSPTEYNDENNGIPYITGASNFENGQVSLVRWTPVPQVITRKGDLLLTCKGTIGEIAHNNFGEAHIARQIMAIRNNYNLNVDFLVLCIEYSMSKIKQAAKGLIPGISREDILNLIIPIPPEKQQNEIISHTNKCIENLSTISIALN